LELERSIVDQCDVVGELEAKGTTFARGGAYWQGEDEPRTPLGTSGDPLRVHVRAIWIYHTTLNADDL
jgi:hypothetical protein